MNGQQPSSDSPRNLLQQIDINFALQAAGVGIWVYDTVNDRVDWDERCSQLFGLDADSHLNYQGALGHIHPDDVSQVATSFQQAMDPQTGGLYDQTYRTIGVNDQKLRWVRFQGQACFNEAGAVSRFSGVAQEVTQQILDRQFLEESQQQVLRQFEQSPVGIATISGDELIFRSANPFYGQLVGRQPEQLVGKPLLEALPEIQGQGFDDLLREVIRTNNPYIANEVAVDLVRQGQLETIYVDLTYQPQQLTGLDDSVLVVATDVTAQVRARQQVEKSEARFRSLIREAPVAVLVYEGPDQVMVEANQEMLDIFGRGTEMLGKPLLEAVPELKDSKLPAYYRQVLATGEPFHQPAERIFLVKNEQPYWGYYNYTYKAFMMSKGRHTALSVPLSTSPSRSQPTSNWNRAKRCSSQ